MTFASPQGLSQKTVKTLNPTSAIGINFQVIIPDQPLKTEKRFFEFPKKCNPGRFWALWPPPFHASIALEQELSSSKLASLTFMEQNRIKESALPTRRGTNVLVAILFLFDDGRGDSLASQPAMRLSGATEAVLRSLPVDTIEPLADTASSSELHTRQEVLIGVLAESARTCQRKRRQQIGLGAISELFSRHALTLRMPMSSSRAKFHRPKPSTTGRSFSPLHHSAIA